MKATQQLDLTNTSAGEPGRASQYLTFSVGTEMFATAISTVKEILEYRVPTDVPMMPSFMRGVINLRGRVVPVIDLSARFYRCKGEITRRSCIVILEIHHDGVQEVIGVVVDSVSAVLEIADQDIKPPPSFGVKLPADCISGMASIGQRFVVVLDMDKVLSIDELSSVSGVAEDAHTEDGRSLHLVDGATS